MRVREGPQLPGPHDPMMAVLHRNCRHAVLDTLRVPPRLQLQLQGRRHCGDTRRRRGRTGSRQSPGVWRRPRNGGGGRGGWRAPNRNGTSPPPPPHFRFSRPHRPRFHGAATGASVLVPLGMGALRADAARCRQRQSATVGGWHAALLAGQGGWRGGCHERLRAWGGWGGRVVASASRPPFFCVGAWRCPPCGACGGNCRLQARWEGGGGWMEGVVVGGRYPLPSCCTKERPLRTHRRRRHTQGAAAATTHGAALRDAAAPHPCLAAPSCFACHRRYGEPGHVAGFRAYCPIVGRTVVGPPVTASGCDRLAGLAGSWLTGGRVSVRRGRLVRMAISFVPLPPVTPAADRRPQPPPLWCTHLRCGAPISATVAAAVAFAVAVTVTTVCRTVPRVSRHSCCYCRRHCRRRCCCC